MTTSASREPPLPGDAAGYYDKCMLHDAGSIRTQLQQLIDKRCMLTASGNEGAVSMLTAPLAIEHATLWVDVPPNTAVLQSLLHCARLSFEGAIDKVTLHFSSGPPTLGTHEGRPALRLPLPECLLHLQRRELMRRKPRPGGLNCLVPARDPASAPPATTTIRDIGGGGLAILVADDGLALATGDLLPGCVIELPELGAVEVTLRVCHVLPVRQCGKDVRQAGCEFVDLPAATETKLFRYLMQLDREQLARRREHGSE